MADADAAERRGDAAAALAIMEANLYGSDGKIFWRPWRVLRLVQLAVFGSWLPRWAHSRWLLELALQEMNCLGRDRIDRSMEIALELQGGAENVRRPPGEDPRVKVMDHDWVFRQCVLYELGGLASFLRRLPQDRIALADQVREWAATPLGGYRLVERRPDLTTWDDLATGERISIANIGSAVLVETGEHVIGRLVPIEDGRMFESTPLRVPHPVAAAVAGDPASWLTALRDARTEGEPAATGGCRFGFLSDVPLEVVAITLYDLSDGFDDHSRGADGLQAAARRAFAAPPGDDEVDVWACIGAEILRPSVFLSLVDGSTAVDGALFARLATTLAEPAATLCRQIAAKERDAA